MTTAVTGAEALINSRPLTYQSVYPNDDVPLTPNYFLHGKMGGIFAPETFDPRNRWKRVHELVRHFWKKWMREWLPTLQTHRKWSTSASNLKVGDVVVVVSPETPLRKWPLGRILQIYTGPDGCVRVVDVKVGSTVLKRHVTKIFSVGT